MASGSRQAAQRKQRESRDSAASMADFFDETSSEDSEDELNSSDFVSESDSDEDRPGTSASTRR